MATSASNKKYLERRIAEAKDLGRSVSGIKIPKK
jgi:hypothetical protein